MIEILGNNEYPISEEESVVLSRETIQIQKILEDAERGERFFYVALPERNPIISFQTPCIIRALVNRLEIAGVFVNNKQLANFLTNKLLYADLPVEPLPQDARIAIYEEFQTWIWRNEAEFQDQDTLVRIQYAADRMSADVIISTITMRDFFNTARIREEQQTQILRYWRDRGWLKTQASQQHTLTVVAKYVTSRGDKFMRAYRITVPIAHGWGVETIGVEIV